MGALRSSAGESAGSFPAHPLQERVSGIAVHKEEDEGFGRLWFIWLSFQNTTFLLRCFGWWLRLDMHKEPLFETSWQHKPQTKHKVAWQRRKWELMTLLVVRVFSFFLKLRVLLSLCERLHQKHRSTFLTVRACLAQGHPKSDVQTGLW